ncbi:SDR family oxidoreductase [bacterium]|nr:SDR family oxidoreductase [bacterium]
MSIDYLVTGGAGFIGSNICWTLIEQGNSVRVLDNFSTGKRANLEKIAADLEIIEGDIRDEAMVHRAMNGVRFVLHQAALPSVPRSLKDPLSSHEVNATGLLVMLKEAVAAEVERFVFASSSSVYGDQPVPVKTESLVPSPRSPYALTKLIGEQYCQLFSSLYPLSTYCLRYFNVFGPRQDPYSDYAAVVPAFMSAHLGGKSPKIYGDGLQTRDFTFVQNVVAANIAATTHPLTGNAVINIGSGRRTSVLDLCRTIAEKTSSQEQYELCPPRPGDVRDSLADITRARNMLDYHVLYSLEAGLEKTIDWFQTTLERT